MKRKMALFLAAVLTVGTLAACGNDAPQGGSSEGGSTPAEGTKQEESQGGQEEGERPVLTFFDKNSGSKAFDDRIAQEIMNRTGITIELISPTGDPSEKLNLMLAGVDYPDIVLMDRGSDIVNKYIEAGALVNLGDYMDKMPNVVEMYGDNLNKTRYIDGNNYYLSNWYGYDPEPVGAFLVRYDLMVDLVGKERADSDEPFTFSEFREVLRQFKQKYPTLEGKESIPLTIWAPGSADDVHWMFADMLGMKAYYEEDGRLYNRVRDPRYLTAMHMMNDLYTEGLLDKDLYTNQGDMLTQRLSTGNVFAFAASYWGANDANKSLEQTHGEDAIFLPYNVVGDGVDPEDSTTGERSSLGWDAIAITKNCENLDAALAFFDFCASQEGQDLMLWGIEGEDYTLEDGKYTPIGDIVDRLQNDPDAKDETGISRWEWFVKNASHADGSPTRLSTVNRTRVQEYAYKNLEGTYYDTAEYDGLLPAGNDPVVLKSQKVQDIVNQAYAQMVAAPSAEEMEKIYQQMMADVEAAGLADVEEVINENYQKRMAIWNK